MHLNRNAFLAVALALSVQGYSYAEDEASEASNLRAKLKIDRQAYWALGEANGLSSEAAYEFANLNVLKVAAWVAARERQVPQPSEREIGDAYDKLRTDAINRESGLGLDDLIAAGSLLLDKKYSNQ